MKKLVPHTMIKLEAMVYMTELFPSEELVGNANSGWKTLLSRKFEGFVTSEDVLQFINDACDIYKSRRELKFVEFDHAGAAAALFTQYKHTVDENNLGFIIRLKTNMKCEDVEEKTAPKWYVRYLPYNFSLWLWNSFKFCYNGIIDLLRID